MYIEADSSYCTFYCTNNKKIIYSKSSSEVEKMLPSNLFVRIHKSYIVNSSFIKDDTIDKKEITLINGTVLPIARRRLEEVFSFLKKL
jgi:two-component system LytT family response regulator